MTQIRLRYLERYNDRHGKRRHYFRRPGFKRVPLPGAAGSPEFMAAYYAALEMTDLPESELRREIGAKRTRPGSMGALIVSYTNSASFAFLAPSTQATYRNILAHLREDYGDDSVAGLKARHVRAIVEKKAAAGTPHAANNLKKILSVLMRHAVEANWRDDDPTAGVRPVRVKSKGHHSWTDIEIAAFEARWPVGTRARLAMGLLIYTGQRRGDVVRMGRQHVRAGAIEVVQQKTGATLAIPLHPALRTILDAAPKDHLTYLTTHHGKPFTAAGFGNWFRECCDAAGLKHCSSHGLRHAAGRCLAEAGCTPHQIAAITGHKSLKEVERYTRAAEQERLATDAMANLIHSVEGTAHEQNCLTTKPGAAKR